MKFKLLFFYKVSHMLIIITYGVNLQLALGTVENNPSLYTLTSYNKKAALISPVSPIAVTVLAFECRILKQCSKKGNHQEFGVLYEDCFAYLLFPC